MNPQPLTNISTERFVISGLCQFGQDVYFDIIDIIDAKSFTNTVYQTLFKIISECLDSNPEVDIPSIMSIASDKGLDGFITKEIDLIDSLFSIPIKKNTVEGFAKKLARLGIARQAAKALQTAYNKILTLNGDESVDHISSIAEEPVLEFTSSVFTQSDDTPKLLFEDAEQYLDYLKENKCDQVGISTGSPLYDKSIGGGIRPGAVDLCVARPKSGKSSDAKQVCLHVAKQSIPVLLIDTEMNEDEQKDRCLSSETNIGVHTIERGQFGNTKGEETLREWVRENKGLPIYHINVAGRRFAEILAIIRRWVRRVVKYDPTGKANPCLVVYDYFKLMDMSDLDNLSEHQAMGYQVTKLKDFCTLNGVGCKAYVQANRGGLTDDDTEGIVSQSDRLSWLCTSLTILRKKAPEEIAQDGPENGNTKLIPVFSRYNYGEGLEPGDWINLEYYRGTTKFKEINTKSEVMKAKKRGFESGTKEKGAEGDSVSF